MSDDDRLRLNQRLREVLGDDEAATLMERLPRDPWDRLATKEDLKAFATKEDLKAFATKEDLKAFATKEDLKAFATKAELTEVRIALQDDIKDLRRDVHVFKAEVEATIASSISLAMAQQTRGIVLSLFAAMMSSVSVSLLIARLA